MTTKRHERKTDLPPPFVTKERETKQPPPYKRGASWELLTDVSASLNVIPAITLRHTNGTRVILQDTPKNTWALMEARLHLVTRVSRTELNLVGLGYQVTFLGHREDYLCVECVWSGSRQ